MSHVRLWSIWKGEGDQNDCDDPLNWEGGIVPTDGSTVLWIGSTQPLDMPHHLLDGIVHAPDSKRLNRMFSEPHTCAARDCEIDPMW